MLYEETCIDFDLPLSEASLTLNEAFYGKSANLLRAEALIATMREKYGSRNHDAVNSSEELRELENVLGAQFNAEMKIVVSVPKPITGVGTIAGRFLGYDTGQLGQWTRMSLIPNAFTIPVLVTQQNQADRIEMVETKSGVRFKERMPVYTVVLGALFFSDRLNERSVLAIILHEIGHNFFIMTDIKARRGLILLASRLYAAYNSIKRLINGVGLIAAGQLRDAIEKAGLLPVISHFASHILSLVLSIDPSKTTGLITFVDRVAALIEKILSTIIPSAIYDPLTSAFTKLNVSKGIATLFTSIGLLMTLRDIAVLGPTFIVHCIVNEAIETAHGFFMTEVMASRRDEIFADDFATKHGYGPDLAEAMVVFHGIAKATRNLKLTRIFWGTEVLASISHALKDAHPAEIYRVKRAVTVLEEELANGTFVPSQEKMIRQQLAQARDVHARLLGEIRGTPEEALIPFYDELCNVSLGRGSPERAINLAMKAVEGPSTPVNEAHHRDLDALEREVRKVVVEHYMGNGKTYAQTLLL